MKNSSAGAVMRLQAHELLRKPPVRKPEGPMQLQYNGFDQVQNVRQFKFDGITRGRATLHFVVCADLTLFMKHRVAMQEGPALSFYTLTAQLEALLSGPDLHLQHAVTDDDVQAYVSTRVVPKIRKNPPRRWRNPRRNVVRPQNPGLARL